MTVLRQLLIAIVSLGLFSCSTTKCESKAQTDTATSDKTASVTRPIRAFQNDAAFGLVMDVTQRPHPLKTIENALERPDEDIDDYNYVDCDICERAIAASAIVLTLSGNPPSGTHDKILKWSQEAAPAVSEQRLQLLRRRAVLALDTCRGDNSECVEIREPAEGAVEEWYGELDALRRALEKLGT